MSVVSNAVPRAMADLCRRALEGRWKRRARCTSSCTRLMQAAFCESNPIPVKAALAMMGRIENELRLPLVPMDPKHEAKLRASLVEAGALAT